jgi:hypothetical protein
MKMFSIIGGNPAKSPFPPFDNFATNKRAFSLDNLLFQGCCEKKKMCLILMNGTKMNYLQSLINNSSSKSNISTSISGKNKRSLAAIDVSIVFNSLFRA